MAHAILQEGDREWSFFAATARADLRHGLRLLGGESGAKVEEDRSQARQKSWRRGSRWDDERGFPLGNTDTAIPALKQSGISLSPHDQPVSCSNWQQQCQVDCRSGTLDRKGLKVP
jgi:hypothetical protein